MAQLKAALTLNSNVYGGKKTSYVSSYSVNSAFDTTFKVNNADALNQLVSFKTNIIIINTYNIANVANPNNMFFIFFIFYLSFNIF